MKIIVAPDSFKESLSAPEAAQMMEKGIKSVFSEAEVVRLPLADGGEGLTRTLVEATGGEIEYVDVTGPLGEKVRGFFGILGDGFTAVLEMAVASGLPLVPRDNRNPLVTTTYGTGELIRAAIAAGSRRIIVGIGGSATNDGGAGMAQALGVRLLDQEGNQIGLGAQGLLSLAAIDPGPAKSVLAGIEITVACDVDNPLTGPRGAAAIYGPQKGATPEMIPILDNALGKYAALIKEQLGIEVANLPGAGAAGGLGAGLVAFCGATLRRGTELVLDTLGFEKVLAQGVDLVLTGEGEINKQTIYGKVPVGVAQLAQKYGVPVIAIVGSIGKDSDTIYDYGIDALMTIVPRPVSLEQAMAEAGNYLAEATARAMRLVNIGMTKLTLKGGGNQ